MWLHMKMGEVIWKTHVIPTTDLFSFTTNHHAFISHEWLSQVLIYGAYRWGGYSGLMLWLCFFTTALFISGFGLCRSTREMSKRDFWAPWWSGSLPRSVSRDPAQQMIGYLFLISELLLLHTLGALGIRCAGSWRFHRCSRSG